MKNKLPRILLVEDNATLRETSLKYLKECYNLDIKGADGCLSALEIFEKDKYDVVLIDAGAAYLEGTYKDTIREVGGFSVQDHKIIFSGVDKLRLISPSTIFVGYSAQDYSKNLEFRSHFERILWKANVDYLDEDFIPFLRDMGYNVKRKD